MTKEIFRLALQQLSRFYLKKRPNTIIGILGTEGKKFVRYYLREILKINNNNLGLFSYNTEIGLPLAIFQVKVPYQKSFILWGNVLIKIISKTLTKYPQKLMVLEYGLKNNPDAKNLLAIKKPDFFIFHNLNKNENYRPMETEAEFKKFIEQLPKNSTGIFNFDEPIVMEISHYFTGKKYFYSVQKLTPTLKKEQYLVLNNKGKISENITSKETELDIFKPIKDYQKENDSERSALAGAMLMGLSLNRDLKD